MQRLGLVLMPWLVAVLSPNASAMCFDQAGQRYGISSDLLRAIAKVESDLNPSAVNTSHQHRTGTVDLGLMQINSGHLRRLAEFGVTKEALLRDPCLNANVGAWVLADHFARHGTDWNAVGAYNASCTQLAPDDCVAARRRYAWKVHSAMQAQKAVKGGEQPAAQVNLPRAPVEPQFEHSHSLRLVQLAARAR